MSIQHCDTPICQRAAESTVKKVFEIFGVDIDEPTSVESFREDLRLRHRLRKAADQGLLTLAAAVLVGMTSKLGDC